MKRLLRLLQLVTMTTWVGGLLFFAFVLAPTAFHVLPSVHDAGLVVGASLKLFDKIALASGAVFLVATAVLHAGVPGPFKRLYRIELVIAFVMLLATACLQWSIIPAMDRDQQLAGGDINTLDPSSPPRVHFEALHHRSEQTAGGVLLLGLAVVFLLSHEGTIPRGER